MSHTLKKFHGKRIYLKYLAPSHEGTLQERELLGTIRAKEGFVSIVETGMPLTRHGLLEYNALREKYRVGDIEEVPHYTCLDTDHSHYRS